MEIVQISVAADRYGDNVYGIFLGVNKEAAYRQFKNYLKNEGERIIEELENKNGIISKVTTNFDIYTLFYDDAEVEE